MPGENIQDWSTSATLNGNADSAIGWAEGQPRASVNNSARSMMAAHAKDRNLKNGSIITGGTANAQTFFSGLDYTTIPTGLRVLLKIGPTLTNTGAATLNMDNIGAVAIIDQFGGALPGGRIFADINTEFIYNGTNWVLLAPVTATAPIAGESSYRIATTGWVHNEIAAASLTNVREFKSTAVYPTTTATCKVLVYMKAGGGGGGAATVPGPHGGGGGEGEEAWFLTTAAALSGSTMTVGAGGLQGFDGNPGNASGVGVLGSVGGGLGGARGDFGGAGGAGGSGGTGGFFRMPGAAGQCGSDAGGTIGINAAGGGKGGGGRQTSGVANSGGGGGCGTNVNSPGNGGSGVIVCFEYGIV